MGDLTRFGSVCSPYWTETFIVGGGPSLNRFNFELLRGRTTLAVNDAAVALPWATALFSLDATWIKKRREFLPTFAGERYLAPPDGDPMDIDGVICLRRSHDPGLSFDPDVVCLGGTSGYGALNVAVLKKSRRIWLLGFDYTGTQHWFPQYPWHHNGNEGYYPGWAEKFRDARTALYKRRVEVFTVGLGSRVDAFPRISIENFVRRLSDGVDL